MITEILLHTNLLPRTRKIDSTVKGLPLTRAVSEIAESILAHAKTVSIADAIIITTAENTFGSSNPQVTTTVSIDVSKLPDGIRALAANESIKAKANGNEVILSAYHRANIFGRIGYRLERFLILHRDIAYNPLDSVLESVNGQRTITNYTEDQLEDYRKQAKQPSAISDANAHNLKVFSEYGRSRESRFHSITTRTLVAGAIAHINEILASVASIRSSIENQNEELTPEKAQAVTAGTALRTAQREEIRFLGGWIKSAGGWNLIGYEEQVREVKLENLPHALAVEILQKVLAYQQTKAEAHA